MSIPRYWKRASKIVKSREGKELKLTAWGWSDVGDDDARKMAERRVQDNASRVLTSASKDEYPYPRTPLREEIIEDISLRGEEFDIITRNRYGASVLNSSSVYFADIDFDGSATKQSVFGALGRLFGKKPDKSVRDLTEEGAFERIDKFLTLNRGWGFRIYRTFGGLRLIATHGRVKVSDSSAIETLKSLGSDPRYIKLCEIQSCYRARLSPKPWRCGFRAPTITYPFENEESLREFDDWKRGYEASAGGFAACKYIKSMGLSVVGSDVSEIVSLHDERTGALTGMPLA